jgi:hypothetical protein
MHLVAAAAYFTVSLRGSSIFPIFSLHDGRRARLKNSLPSVSRLSRKCAILEVSQVYKPPEPALGINSFSLL